MSHICRKSASEQCYCPEIQYGPFFQSTSRGRLNQCGSLHQRGVFCLLSGELGYYEPS